MSFSTKAVILFLTISFSGQASISITFTSPSVGGFSGQLMNIQVGVTSTYSIDTVWAEVEDKKIGLNRLKGGGYGNKLSIADLPQGKLRIRVFAEDILGNTATGSRNFSYDTAPTINIISPTINSAYLSKIHIKAVASDIGGDCIVKVSHKAFNLTFTNSIDTMLAAEYGYEPVIFSDIQFVVQDKVGQKLVRNVPIYLEDSKVLVPFFKSDGDVLDFKDTRALTVTRDADNVLRYRIVNTVDHSSLEIPLPDYQYASQQAILYDDGAVINLGDTCYLWNGNQVINLNKAIGFTDYWVHAGGFYLVGEMYNQTGDRLVVVDMRTVEVIYKSLYYIGEFNATSDHKMFYKVNNSLYQYDIPSKQTTTIASNINAGWPVGNGNLVAYMTFSPSFDEPRLNLFDGNNQQMLAEDDNYDFDYFVEDGYVLFAKPDKNQKRQVWLRNPDNTQKQLSFFSAASKPLMLGQNGRVLFTNSKNIYYADSRTSFKQVSGTLGKPYFVNNDFYLALGNTIFKYDLIDPLPVTWEYFNGEKTPEGIKLTWATSTEANAESFTVQRSTNGRIFTDITTIPASGNSSQRKEYQYIDYTAAAIDAKTIYYRLRQSDFDLKSSYSSIVAVQHKENSDEIEVNAFPNPFNSNLSLQVSDSDKIKGGDHISIYSIDGNKKYTQDLEKGKNVIELRNLPNLERGLYLLETYQSGKSSISKIVKE